MVLFSCRHGWFLLILVLSTGMHELHRLFTSMDLLRTGRLTYAQVRDHQRVYFTPVYGFCFHIVSLAFTMKSLPTRNNHC